MEFWAAAYCHPLASLSDAPPASSAMAGKSLSTLLASPSRVIGVTASPALAVLAMANLESLVRERDVAEKRAAGFRSPKSGALSQ